MLKKIGVGDARMGMFVHEVCGSWQEHPFWNRSFELSAPEELATLRECGVREIWIDTEKGLDVPPGTAAATRRQENEKVDGALRSTAAAARGQAYRAALHEEMARAVKVHARAKAAVASLFGELRLGRALKTEAVTAPVDEIIRSVSANPGALLSLARLKAEDDYIYAHSVAVCALMAALGRQFGIEGAALRSLGIAGLLHDAGNVLMPPALLNKPRKMTDAEFNMMKSHAQIGRKLLQSTPGLDETVLDVCLHHHERTDGAGYPERLGGEALSLPAQMCAVCDVYDTIACDGYNTQGLTPAMAVRRMAEWQDGHFDQTVFHAFVKTVGIYPAGTLLKLRSDRLAVVTDPVSGSLLTPVVKAFFSARDKMSIFPERVDLSRARDAIASVEHPARWGFDLKTIAAML